MDKYKAKLVILGYKQKIWHRLRGDFFPGYKNINRESVVGCLRDEDLVCASS